MNPSGHSAAQPTRDVRARAAVIISQLLAQHGSLSTLLTRSAEDRDFALLQELCFGTCRWYYQLDAILKQLLTRPLKAKDADVRALLLIGLYQLQHLDIAAYAVINETVSATRALGKDWARSLVNAVMRNYQRRHEELLPKATAGEAGRFAHPQWLIERLRSAWPGSWQDVLEANNLRPPMTLRINRRKTTRDDYLLQLQQGGIEARAGQLADTAIYLQEACPVERLPGFAVGMVSVQDEASQLVPGLLQPGPGMRVLDACAAPGGKSCHILESERSLSELVALDNSSRRLERMQQNLERLQLKAHMITADAQRLDSWWDGQPFDRILLDAPCSATGIIRRHPDIKLLRRPADIQQLRSIQLQLLQSLWHCLKPGGILLYSTCSILPEENHQIIEAFLDTQADAKDQEISAQWGVECPRGRQLLPDPSGHDGFYFALLRKPG